MIRFALAGIVAALLAAMIVILVVRAESTCVRAGWAVNGRGRSHRCEITWFVSSATAAATSPDADASFQRTLP